MSMLEEGSAGQKTFHTRQCRCGKQTVLVQKNYNPTGKAVCANPTLSFMLTNNEGLGTNIIWEAFLTSSLIQRMHFRPGQISQVLKIMFHLILYCLPLITFYISL